MTGATGFIGARLLPLLAECYDVAVLCRRQPEHPFPGVEYHEFDILRGDPERLPCAGRETLVHLAWGLPHENYWADKGNLRWLQRSADLLKWFLASGGKHAHMAGTCAEYDWSGKMPLSEDESRLRPRGLYGKCKNALRLAAGRLCAGHGATLGWHRIFWPYGPGQDDRKFVPSLIQALLSGRKASCMAANWERDYIHVDDAARLMALAIHQNFSGALNIGSGKAVPLGSIARKAAALLRREDLLSLDEKPVSRDNPRQVEACVARQKAIAGYAPAYDIESGLADTAAFLRNAGPDSALLAAKPPKTNTY